MKALLLSDNERITSATLIHALKAHGGSNREVAEGVRVSFRAIAEARNGFNRSDFYEPRKHGRGVGKLLGTVSSITRLAVYLGVEHGVVLEELGIDPSDAAVQRHIERARDTASPKTLRAKDSALDRVKLRELAKKRPGPIVGIVPWRPFSEVAKSLVRSMLGSLNPAWDREANIVSEVSFGVAEQRLLSDDPDTPECIVGMYDMPCNRQRDIEVVSLPGLYVRVGGLCTQEISWVDILTGRGKALPHALVIEEDVGDKLLSGPVDYPNARLINPRLTTRDPHIIVERVKYEITHRQQPNGLLLVADGPLVSAVQSALVGTGVKMLEINDPTWAPVYRFGFAVRSDAQCFKQLIESVISQDLLGRVFPRTVNLYLKLLQSDQTGQVRLNLAEMRSPSHPDGDSKFLELAQEFEPEIWETLLSNAVTDQDAFNLLTVAKYLR